MSNYQVFPNNVLLPQIGTPSYIKPYKQDVIDNVSNVVMDRNQLHMKYQTNIQQQSKIVGAKGYTRDPGFNQPELKYRNYVKAEFIPPVPQTMNQRHRKQEQIMNFKPLVSSSQQLPLPKLQVSPSRNILYQPIIDSVQIQKSPLMDRYNTIQQLQRPHQVQNPSINLPNSNLIENPSRNHAISQLESNNTDSKIKLRNMLDQQIRQQQVQNNILNGQGRYNHSAMVQTREQLYKEQDYLRTQIQQQSQLIREQNKIRDFIQSQQQQRDRRILKASHPAGVNNMQRRPPVGHRFNLNRNLRNQNQDNYSSTLHNQNRLYALIQQQNMDRDVENMLVHDIQVPHTEVEGFRAISKATVHKMPNDMNGLRQAMNPKEFQSPLRERRIYQSHQTLPRLHNQDYLF